MWFFNFEKSKIFESQPEHQRGAIEVGISTYLSRRIEILMANQKQKKEY